MKLRLTRFRVRAPFQPYERRFVLCMSLLHHLDHLARALLPTTGIMSYRLYLLYAEQYIALALHHCAADDADNAR